MQPNARRPVSVLVVDGDPIRLGSIRSLLEPLAINVVCAASGEEALRSVVDSHFAAMLIDVDLPGIDGFETARLLKLRSCCMLTPILFFTNGELDETQESRAYGMGIVDFIVGSRIQQVLVPKLRAFVGAAEMNAAAEQSGAAQADFISLAAHELRAPLGVSWGYVSMLQDGTLGDVPPGWQRPLQVIADKIDEVRDLLEDLFMIARLDSEQDGCECSKVDLTAEVDRAVSRADARVELLGGNIRFESPPRRVEAFANPAHLGRILDNLINNALIYSGGPPRLSIRVSSAGNPVVTIADEGAGIPDDMQERVFDRSTRYAHPGLAAISGTGLGLYLSRRLAQQQGGSLVLEESHVGAGSRFALTLSSTDIGSDGLSANPKPSERRLASPLG